MIINPSLNSLTSSQDALNTSMQRLASGSRINSAKDDAAGLAVAVSLASQLGSDSQVMANVSTGLSLAETAGGALNQVTDTLLRMRQLAVQAANAGNTSSDLQAIQQEFSQLGQNLDQIAGNTTFNGQALLNGTFSSQFQVGPNAGNSLTFSLGSVSVQDLGLSGADVSGNASAVIASIDAALASVGGMQANLGAVQGGLNSTMASLSGTYESLAAARSSIADTNYDQESTSLAQNSVKNEAALKATALYNANQANLLGLLKSSS